jgi:DNA-binding MarR family transcriptional regulator
MIEPAADRLCFLLARHGQVMNARLRQALGLTGLSTRQAAVLLRLARLGPCSQQDFLEALAIDASGLVAVLNDLERDGLVLRRRDPADRRRHIVAITSAGEHVVETVETAITALERDTFATLTSAEVAALHDLMARLRIRPGEGACD